MAEFEELQRALVHNQPIPQASDNDRWYFRDVEKHFLSSRYVDQTFEISIAYPPRRRSDALPLPVVYVTDANFVFTLFKEYAHLMQLFAVHPFPPFILVGVGYPGENQASGMLLRVRDFSTPDYFDCDMRAVTQTYSMVEGLLKAKEGSKNYKASDDFLKFFSEELIPFIEKHHSIDARYRTYFGHSGGGLFGLYVLTQESELFKNYIISSPGFLSYERNEFGFEMVGRFLETAKLAQSINVHLSVGAEEDFQPLFFGEPKLVSNFYRLAAMFKQKPVEGLHFTAEAIPGEVHNSVWPIAFIHGVQTVFGFRSIGGAYMR